MAKALEACFVEGEQTVPSELGVPSEVALRGVGLNRVLLAPGMGKTFPVSPTSSLFRRMALMAEVDKVLRRESWAR